MNRTFARLAAVSLVAACLANPARGSAVQSYMYSTTGDIAGIANSNSGYPINLSTQSTAMLSTPGTFVLGTITTSPLPTGATLSYDNTPFNLALNVGPVGSNSYGYYQNNGTYYNGIIPAYTYQISGVLNGSLHGDGTSTLFPTVTSITGSGSTPPFSPSDLKFNLQGIAAPNGTTYGSTTLTASVDVVGAILPAPAPGTAAATESPAASPTRPPRPDPASPDPPPD